jgi:hypothetical protein
MFNLFKKKASKPADIVCCRYHKKVGIEICFRNSGFKEKIYSNFNYSHSKEETDELQKQCQEEISTLYRKLNAGTSEFFKPTDDLCIRKDYFVFAVIIIQDVQD